MHKLHELFRLGCRNVSLCPLEASILVYGCVTLFTFPHFIGASLLPEQNSRQTDPPCSEWTHVFRV
jgi:hypothetical protein